MLHFTFQNMRTFYGPWPRGLGLRILLWKQNCESQIVKEFFFQTFFDVFKNTKADNFKVVWLRGVMHAAQSDSVVCIPRRVK